jgi:hypothetical protein
MWPVPFGRDSRLMENTTTHKPVLLEILTDSAVLRIGLLAAVIATLFLVVTTAL